jgi:hypothetical protein
MGRSRDGVLVHIAGTARCATGHAPGAVSEAGGDAQTVKKARRGPQHPVGYIIYSAERRVFLSLRSGRKRKASAWRSGRARLDRHGHRPIARPSLGVAAKRRNCWTRLRILAGQMRTADKTGND